MFGYEILRNKWVILAMFCGLALVFYFILHYYDYYTPRRTKPDDSDAYETEYLGAWNAIPWSLKITITVILIFALIFSIHALKHPNSW